MATSGTINLYSEASTNNGYFIFNWARTEVSARNNSSTVSWSLSYYCQLSGLTQKYYLTQDVTVKITVDGATSAFILSKGTVFNNGANPIYETRTQTIAHNMDGTKKVTVDLSTVATGMAEQFIGGTFTLDTISRKAYILTATPFTDQENPVITYLNISGISTDTLQACIANSTGTVIYVPYRDIPKVATIEQPTPTYTFNLTIEERNALRAAATGSSLPVRFYVKSTFGEYEFYDFLARTMTLEDVAPTLEPIVKDNDKTTTALTGNNQKLIFGFSDIYYDIGVTAPEGTSIINQSIKCGAKVYTTIRGLFSNVTTNVVEFSATDSRGNVALKTVELNTVPYIRVTCNQTVRLNLDGTIALSVSGNCFTESFGAASNSLTVQNRWREYGGEWSEWGDISPLISDMSNGLYALTATMSGFDPSGTYEFQSRAIDKLTTADSTIETVTLKPIFDWGKYDFNFNVPLTIEGAPLADYVIEQGSTPMGSNGVWHWYKWKSGKAECYGCRNYGNMAVTTAWGGLYRSQVFAQDFPAGLFKATPDVIDISMRNSNFGGWIAKHEEAAPDSMLTGGFIIVRPASATLSQVYVSFHVIGRW